MGQHVASGQPDGGVLSHPSFQRRLESRRTSARWGGWGRGYSATRYSSGGWNPGAQRAAGRLGERVLSHPSFQRRLESRRASARWGDWEVRVLSHPLFQRRLESRRASARWGDWEVRVLSHPLFQRRLESRRASARWGDWEVRVLSHPSFQRRLESRRASARWGGWGRGYSATRYSSGGWNPGAQARGGATGR